MDAGLALGEGCVHQVPDGALHAVGCFHCLVGDPMLVLPLVRLRTCPDSDRAGIYATFGQHRSWVPSSHRHRIDVLVAWVRIRGVVGGEVLSF